MDKWVKRYTEASFTHTEALRKITENNPPEKWRLK